MKRQLYNGKEIIWESELKQLCLIVISFVFVSVAIFIEQNSWKKYLTLFLFGSGGIFFTVRFFNPRFIFVKPGSEKGKEIQRYFFEIEKLELGKFKYADTGFSVNGKNFDWNSIDAVFSFKIDDYVTDEICIELFCGEETISLSESTPGWYQFIERMEKNLLLDSSWMTHVATPAFETNLSLIYDKDNLGQEDAVLKYYN